MYLKVYEVSSGFRNIQNGICFADNYNPDRDSKSRPSPDSAYDTPYTIDIPDGYEYTEACDGTMALYRNNHHIALSSINHNKMYVTGVSIEGFHRFPIVKEG